MYVCFVSSLVKKKQKKTIVFFFLSLQIQAPFSTFLYTVRLVNPRNKSTDK